MRRRHELEGSALEFLPGGEQEAEGKHEMRDEQEGAHTFNLENQLRLKQSLPHARFGWLLLGSLLSVPCRALLSGRWWRGSGGGRGQPIRRF